MNLLAIETSTERGSVAVLNESTLLFEEHFAADRGCGAVLFSLLERALQAAPEPAAIVVGLGPGSYSGVRIAIAAAIGLSIGTKAKLLGISSLVAMDESTAHYATVGDARRASFHFAEIHNGVCVEGPMLLDAQALTAKTAALKVPLLGSAPMAVLPQVTLRFPQARFLAQLALQDRSIVARDNLEPIYMRDPHITQPRASIR